MIVLNWQTSQVFFLIKLIVEFPNHLTKKNTIRPVITAESNIDASSSKSFSCNIESQTKTRKKNAVINIDRTICWCSAQVCTQSSSSSWNYSHQHTTQQTQPQTPRTPIPDPTKQPLIQTRQAHSPSPQNKPIMSPSQPDSPSPGKISGSIVQMFPPSGSVDGRREQQQ